MANAVLMAWSSPVSEEREAEFTTWYTDVHIPQVKAALSGVISTTRYRVLGSGSDGRPARYLCCYELGASDAAAAAAALAEARKSGAFEMSDTLDLSVAPPVLEFVEPVA